LSARQRMRMRAERIGTQVGHGHARGRVRAKTGTTRVASALSGYVGARYAFAVVQNGDPVAWVSAREAQDRFVRTLVALARGR